MFKLMNCLFIITPITTHEENVLLCVTRIRVWLIRRSSEILFHLVLTWIKICEMKIGLLCLSVNVCVDAHRTNTVKGLVLTHSFPHLWLSYRGFQKPGMELTIWWASLFFWRNILRMLKTDDRHSHCVSKAAKTFIKMSTTTFKTEMSMSKVFYAPLNYSRQPESCQRNRSFKEKETLEEKEDYTNSSQHRCTRALRVRRPVRWTPSLNTGVSLLWWRVQVGSSSPTEAGLRSESSQWDNYKLQTHPHRQPVCVSLNTTVWFELTNLQDNMSGSHFCTLQVQSFIFHSVLFHCWVFSLFSKYKCVIYSHSGWIIILCGATQVNLRVTYLMITVVHCI